MRVAVIGGRVSVRMGCVSGAGVRATLGFKRLGGFLHGQVHGAQQVSQHMVGLDFEVIGLQFDGHVAVAQVVGSAGQVKRTAVGGAGGDDQHRLGGGNDLDQRAVFGNEHIPPAHQRAAWQKDAQGTACGVGGVKAAFLAHVPVEFDAGGAFEEHRGQAGALGDEFGGCQHGLWFEN